MYCSRIAPSIAHKILVLVANGQSVPALIVTVSPSLPTTEHSISVPANAWLDHSSIVADNVISFHSFPSTSTIESKKISLETAA